MTWFGYLMILLQTNTILWNVASEKLTPVFRVLTVVVGALMILGIMLVGTGHLS